MENTFTPFADRYRNLDDNIIYGDKSFLGDNESDIVNSDDFFNKKLPLWVAYYRKFPHRFVEDYFGIELKPFQVYLLYEMMKSPNTFICASRGLGKTWLTALFALVVAILYPGSKIVITSGVKSQAAQILMKIKEIRGMAKVDLLGFDIEEFRESLNTAKHNVEFYNGSYIRLVSSTDNSRGNRATVLIIDESRMVKESVYNATLRRFLSTPRQPRYLNLPQYKHLEERTKTIFLTSAWYKSSWNYTTFKTYWKDFVAKGLESSYRALTFSYEMSIMNGLLSKKALIEEVNEEGFDIARFAMELKSLWSGIIDNGYYEYDKLLKCRSLQYSEYPSILQQIVGDKKFKYNREPGEIRIIVADIALMGNSKQKNDNTVIGYISAKPSKNRKFYSRELRYLESLSGGIPIENHSRRIREMYEEFNADYIVLDTAGLGLTVFNDLSREMSYDGNAYEPLNCMNDESMQKLVADKTAPKVIYSIKATSELNYKMNSDLNDKTIRQRLMLLSGENDADEMFSKYKKYPEWRKGSGEDLQRLLRPYKETSSLINEMVNLELVDEEKLKLKEHSGQRKDRFSMLAMGNYFITQEFESTLNKKKGTGWSQYKISSKSQSYNTYQGSW